MMSISAFHVQEQNHTVKPVLNGHAKEDKRKDFQDWLLPNAGQYLMQVKSIAECCGGAFCNTLDLH